MSTMTPVEALRLLIAEELTDTNFRPYTMLEMVTKRDEFQSSVKWNANVGGAVVSGRAVTAAPSASATDTVKGASLPIGDRVLGHMFSLRRDKIVEAKRTAPGALRELFAEHIRVAFDVIKTGLSAAIYTGNGTAASHGIYGIDYVLDNANAYAGIDGGTYPNWAAYLEDNAGVGRNLTKALVSNTIIAMRRVGVEVDIIVTTPELVEKYKDLFSNDRSLTIPQNGTADLDFVDVQHGRRPILSDTQCPNGTMYFMARNAVELKTYALAGGIMDNESGEVKVEKQMGLNFLVAQLPSNNPHSMSFEISVQPQVVVRDRRSIGAITDLNQ